MPEPFIVLAESFTMTLSDGNELLMRVKLWYNVLEDLFLIYTSESWLNISFSLDGSSLDGSTKLKGGFSYTWPRVIGFQKL